MTSDSRITVLHFSNSTVRAGAEEHMLMLLTRMNRSKFRPMLAAHPALMEKLRDDLPADVTAVPVSLEGPFDLGGIFRFMRALRKCRVDVVHSHMFQASRVASPLAWLMGVPTVIETSHGREPWRRGWLKGNFFIDRLVSRFDTYVIAVSRSTGDYLLNEKKIPESKIVVIRNGIGIERFDPRRTAPPEMRRALGIDDTVPVVLAVARLEPQKAHRILLDAWKSVAAEFPTARLICLGDGQLRETLEAQASALGINSSVSFVGYQANVDDWLALSDFTVLPSLWEGLPLVAIESMAAGRTVVGSAVDGTTEVVLDGKTGLLVPPGDPAALSAAISCLLTSPELARNLGAEGRRFVEEHFGERRQVDETEALYDSARRRRPRVTPARPTLSTEEGQLG
jgi:glycosyltransferase involved in cell wall biosynthesis